MDFTPDKDARISLVVFEVGDEWRVEVEVAAHNADEVCDMTRLGIDTLNGLHRSAHVAEELDRMRN